jgi:hypothetical protein
MIKLKNERRPQQKDESYKPKIPLDVPVSKYVLTNIAANGHL